MTLTYVCAYLSLIYIVQSALIPPELPPALSALVITFENAYELSLLARTLTDNGINSTMLVTEEESDFSINLDNIDILRLPGTDFDRSKSKFEKGVLNCQNFLHNHVSLKLKNMQPTFVILPALRHDGCLLPWIKAIKSTPVLWIQNPDEEMYTFHMTGMAMPIYHGGMWSRINFLRDLRWIVYNAEIQYVLPALQLVEKYIPNEDTNIVNLYSDVNMILWGIDPVLRSDYAVNSKLLVEVGCHHCRDFRSLRSILQKEITDYPYIIVVLLNDYAKQFIFNVAESLMNIFPDVAVVWNLKSVRPDSIEDPFDSNRPKNLFVHYKFDEQDLIGYARTRVVLCYCTDSEVLEAAFHGRPILCMPSLENEIKNQLRAIELGYSYSVHDYSAETIAKAIKHIHETMKYKKNAYKISSAIRDRPNTATDRLVYWLNYLIRYKDQNETILATRNPKPLYYRQLYNVDIWFIVGFLFGITVGILLPFIYGCPEIWRSRRQVNPRMPRSRRKYIKRH